MAEAARQEPQAVEALFCSYGINMAFFESQILGPARSTGAAVTTLTDAQVFPADTRSMASAGIAYVPAVAVISGAFHPKVNIIAGSRRAVVSIGSGNLTVDGWHNNDELCTVFIADLETGCPLIIMEVAQWLESLGRAAPAMSPAGKEALARLAMALSSLAQAAQPIDTGHRLVHTNTTAIIDQLPSGPVQHLRLYAPFHGPDGRAFAALLQRLRPTTVDIAVQTGQGSGPLARANRTVINPAVLGEVAAAHGVDLRFYATDSTRYRHGKLIEAALSDGTVWTLTGSANLSAAALLKAMPGGGNCEVGVVAPRPASTSLFPPVDASPLDGAALPAVTLFAPGESAPAYEAVTLLSAEIRDGQVMVHLSKPATFPVTVEISAYRDQPEERTVLGQVPAGAVSHAFQGLFAGGSRVRLTWDGQDGSTVTAKSERPLIDPATVRRRITTGQSNRHAPTEPSQFFDDPRLAAAWLTAVQTLAAGRATSPTVVSAQPRSAKPDAGLAPADGWRTIDDADTWQAYTDEAAVRLGESVVAFALGGLPRMASLAGAPVTTTPDWVDRPSIQDPTTDEGATVEEIDATADEDLGLHSQTHAKRDPPKKRPFTERKRVRTWIRSVVDTMTGVPAIDRAAMHRIVLLGTRAAFWEAEVGPDGWFDLLADATTRLDGDDIPPNLDATMASLTATAVHLLNYCLTPGLDTREARVYRGVVSQGDHLLLGLEADNLADTLVGITNPLGFDIDPRDVRAHADLIVEPNPAKTLMIEAERAIEDLDDCLPLSTHLWKVTGTFTDSGRAAAALLDLAPEAPLMAVWAVGRHERWAVLIRHDNALTWIDQLRTVTRYRDFTLGPTTSPSSLAASHEAQQNRKVHVNNTSTPTAAAAAALEQCQVCLTDSGPVVRAG